MSQLNPVRLVGAVLLAVARAGLAQADFSGHWAPPSTRIVLSASRPELGDYLASR
jgi:hypothetical protein